MLSVALTGKGGTVCVKALMAGAPNQAEERAHLERRGSAGVSSGLAEVASREAHGRAGAEAGPWGHGRLDALRRGVLRRDVLRYAAGARAAAAQEPTAALEVGIDPGLRRAAVVP